MVPAESLKKVAVLGETIRFTQGDVEEESSRPDYRVAVLAFILTELGRGVVPHRAELFFLTDDYFITEMARQQERLDRPERNLEKPVHRIVAPAGKFEVVYEESGGNTVPKPESLPLNPAVCLFEVTEYLAEQMVAVLEIEGQRFHSHGEWLEPEETIESKPMAYFWDWKDEEGNPVIICLPIDLAWVLPQLGLIMNRVRPDN